MTDDEQQIMNALMTSPAIEMLYHIAQTMPDLSNPDVKSILCASAVQMCFALDNNKIQFSDEDTAAQFYGLLAVSIDHGMNGKLKNSFCPAKVH